MRVKKPQLRVKEYPHSLTARFVIEGLRVNGKRKRLFFRTKAEADLELARIKKKRVREGEDALLIPDSLRIMARDCNAMLAPFRRPSWTRRLSTSIISRILTAASRSRRWSLSTRTQDGGPVCPKYISLIYVIGSGASPATFGSSPVRTITSAQIEDWLHGLELGPQSFNNFRSGWRRSLPTANSGITSPQSSVGDPANQTS